MRRDEVERRQLWIFSAVRCMRGPDARFQLYIPFCDGMGGLLA